MADLDLEAIREVHEALKERGLKVAIAESCTGGLVAHALTLMPGSSGCFDSSIVCYSRHAKSRILGLAESFINIHGTVSEETARAMALAVCERAGVEVGLGITGVLGPDTIEDREVGVVFVAAAFRGEVVASRRLKFEGERDEIKHAASNTALRFLLEALST
ncbi:MAG: CinA family protein [Nitrospirota bacterium]|jgi:nicotinamide-nucleotide amidase